MLLNLAHDPSFKDFFFLLESANPSAEQQEQKIPKTPDGSVYGFPPLPFVTITLPLRSQTSEKARANPRGSKRRGQ